MAFEKFAMTFVIGRVVVDFARRSDKRVVGAEATSSVSPPIVAQAALEESAACAFYDSTNCTFGNAVGLRAMWSGSVVTPAHSLTSTDKFWGIVSIEQLNFVGRTDELLEACDGSCSGMFSIRVNPEVLSSTVIHDKCASVTFT